MQPRKPLPPRPSPPRPSPRPAAAPPASPVPSAAEPAPQDPAASGPTSTISLTKGQIAEGLQPDSWIDAAFESIVVKAETPKEPPPSARPPLVSEPAEEIEPEPDDSKVAKAPEAETLPPPARPPLPLPAPPPVPKPEPAADADVPEDLETEMIRSVERFSAPPPPMGAPPAVPGAWRPSSMPPGSSEEITNVLPKFEERPVDTPRGLGPISFTELQSEPTPPPQPRAPPPLLRAPPPLPPLPSLHISEEALTRPPRSEPPSEPPAVVPRKRSRAAKPPVRGAATVDFARNVLGHGYLARRGVALLFLVLVVYARPGWFNVGDLVLHARAASSHAAFRVHLPYLDP